MSTKTIGCVQHDCAECKAREDAPSTSQPLGALVEVRWDDSTWSRYGLFNSVEIAEATKRHLEKDDKEARVIPLYDTPPKRQPEQTLGAAPSTSPELVEMAAAEQKPIGRFTGKFTVDAHDRMLCEIVCNGAIPTAGAALYDTPPSTSQLQNQVYIDGGWHDKDADEMWYYSDGTWTVRVVYLAVPTKQALEKFDELAEPSASQIVTNLEAVSNEYNEWIRYHAAGGDYDSFLKMVLHRQAAIKGGA